MIEMGLSDSQIEQIRDATERLLEVTGVRVMHDGALKLLRQVGARVDHDGVVKFPRSLLRELIGQAPSQCTVRGLDGSASTIGKGGQSGWAIVTDPWVIDYETRKPRRPAIEDLRRNTSIAQQLDYVVGMSCMEFPVSDVQDPSSDLHALREYLLHHAKHNFIYATSLESIRRWIRIGNILTRGGALNGSGLFSVAVASLSPLTLTGVNVEFLKIACEHGFAVAPTVCPTAGMTSPFSLSGTLLQGNAEIIFLLALAQAYKPGTPFLYTFGPAAADMRTGACLYYTLDKVLWKAAHVRLGRSYGLPVAAECGGAMGYRFDQQSGAEGILFMLAAVSAGADLLAGFGSTLNAVGHSSEMMLIQDAYFRAAQFLARGISPAGEELAVEVIGRVGPGGNFMIDEHTIKRLRSQEFFSHELFDYSGDVDSQDGFLERAHAKVLSLTTHYRSPVPGDIQEALKRFFHDEIAGKTV